MLVSSIMISVDSFDFLPVNFVLIMKRVLSLDVGDKRIGIAMSDTLGILATPLTIVDRQNDEKDVSAIVELVKKHEVGQVLTGLPRSLSGGIGHQAEKVQSFIEQLKRQTDIPVVLRDESFTTLRAQQLMREAESKPKRLKRKYKKEKIRDDAAAAAVLLQAYLDERIFEEQPKGT